MKHARSEVLILVPALALTAMAALSLAPILRGNHASRSVAQTASDAKSPKGKSLTLAQAWDVAKERAVYWQPDAEMVGLTTAYLDSEVSDGRDGLRAAWTARASSAGANAELVIQIVDGEAGEAWENPNTEPAARLDRPLVDSPEALQIASTSTPNLLPAPNGTKGPGFGFALGITADGKTEVVRTLGVMGDLTAYVETDASSGAITGRYLQDYGSNGALLYSADSGKTWEPSTLVGRAVTRVVVDPSDPTAVYATVAGSRGIEVHISSDGGKDWRLLSTLPLDAGSYPQDIAIASFQSAGSAILVGTNSGLWTSTDIGKTWLQHIELGKATAWRLGVRREKQGDVALVSIVSGADTGSLYESADLSQWVKRESGVFRLSSLDAGNSLFGIDDSAGGTGLGLRGGTIDPVNVPVKRSVAADADRDISGNGEYILNGTGSLLPGHRFIVQSQVAVYASIDAGLSWRKTLDGRFASIASSPALDSDGIVVAGGYQSGIYRSSDGGETWENVLPNPFSVTPCSGIVSQVLFPSSTQVLAVNTPTLVWRAL